MAFYLELNQPRSRRPPPPLTPPPPVYPTGPPPPPVRPPVHERAMCHMDHMDEHQCSEQFDEDWGRNDQSLYEEDMQQKDQDRLLVAQPEVEPQPLSSAIERYITWMTCQGIDVPKIEESIHVEAPERFQCATTDFVKKKHPKGILHTPRTVAARSLGKSVRWRDHEQHSKQVCWNPCPVGASALEDIYDDKDKKIPLQRTPTPIDPRGMDDPILSFREQNLNNDRSPQRQRQRQRRPSSPHPPQMRPLSMRRAPSPHPRKMGHNIFSETDSPSDNRRIRVQPLSPLRRRRPDRSPSPLPMGMRSPSSERRNIISNRPPTPRRGGTPQRRPMTPQPLMGDPTRQRSSSQTREREFRQPHPTEQRRYPEFQGRDMHRSPEEQLEERYAELASKPGKKILTELPTPKKEGKHFAEIVWKSKEAIPSPKEEKKRGWKLVKRSPSVSGSSQRETQGTQQEKPQSGRRRMQRGRVPPTIVTQSHPTEDYDSFG